jgi:hypothetical protein
MTTRVVLGLIGWGFFACARPPPAEPEPTGGQSYCEALELICDVDHRAGLASEDDPLERTQRREEFLSDNVKNPDAIYFRTLLKVQGPAEKAAALRREAKKAGLARCHYAERVDDEGL